VHSKHATLTIEGVSVTITAWIFWS